MDSGMNTNGVSQGVRILDFVSSQANLAKLIAALDTPGRIYNPDDKQLQLLTNQYNDLRQESEGRPFMWMRGQLKDRSSTPEKTTRPGASVSRDTGAEIQRLVANATEPVSTIKDVSSIADTSFCEWAYVVDLDAGCLAFIVQLNELPSQEEFVKVCQPAEEDEYEEV
ncbi:hypothetical protein Tdes44962_MAKER09783 [Teratosphaeria destructans]|uniref:Uncharacterized protein n=1 Tax=Teratosphaeria destructans TaxID=418781 RepID=A0A9W7W2C1_9PEZI|nr:hypothetical protein Tdes44962_MAKER09783 [Teratosphaeria destructans]